MGFVLEEATIREIHDAFRTNTLNCVSLTQRYLDRISTYDKKGPALNAFVVLNPNALAEAKQLDAAFAKSGKFVGALHGIPIAVKDQAETRGIETSFGSIALKGYVPDQDATIVTKIKQAGAIILGKTTMPDFAASWYGYGSVHGETKDPYALERDPGGSSAGSGVAVAANLATVGIGEDTGGSIRLPASANNLVGVRVTSGLISRAGLSPLVVFQDTAGPLARTVADAAVLLDVLVGYDPKDKYTTAFTIAGHKSSYTVSLNRDGLKGARIGVLKEAFGSDDDADCAQVNAVVRAAMAAMKKEGADLVDVSLPNLKEFIEETSLYIIHSRHDINTFLAARPKLPYRTINDIYKAGKYHKNHELIEAIVKDGPLKPEDDPSYYRRLAAREAFQRTVVGLIAEHNLDTICFPACQVLTPTHEELRGGRWTVLTYPTNTVIAAQSWLPSICLPAGFSPAGIPVGMEMIVPPYHEPDLFRFGYAFEQLTHWRRPPASAPPL
jgi:Asp-tRNA(Asn)/Glu-tRNA(Gln) amidotransferase A subunit family amidase